MLSLWVHQMFGQDASGDTAFAQEEQQIKELFDSLYVSGDNDEREGLTSKINNQVGEVLKKPGSFDYTFSGLKMITVVTSKKKDIRLITWMVPNLFGTYHHYGYVQLEGKSPKVYELSDNSNNLDKLEQRMLSPDNWFGAVYYELIEKKVNGTKTYTLLGLHGNNASTTMKVIDVMFFDDMGKLKFGAPIFQLPKKLQRRIVFEYSAQATMSLKYHKVRNFWLLKKNMIVLDHLSPPDLSLLNQYQYYGPDFSNDALKFKKGRWFYMEDIEVTNVDMPTSK